MALCKHMDLLQKKAAVLFTNCPLPEVYLSYVVSCKVALVQFSDYWLQLHRKMYYLPCSFPFFSFFFIPVAAVMTEPEALLILNLHENY